MDFLECLVCGLWRGINLGCCKSFLLFDFRVVFLFLSFICLRKMMEVDCFICYMDGWCVVLVDDFVLFFLFELLLDWRVYGGCINLIII